MSLRFLRQAVWVIALCVAASGFSTAARADITSNLAAYYKFDSVSGTSATDSSGNSNTGTLATAVFNQSGKYYFGFSSSGSNSKVTVTNAASLSMTSFTIAAWTKFGTVSTRQYIMEKGASPAANYFFYYQNATGFICGFYDGTSNRTLTYAGTPSTSAWEHYACTFDNLTKAITIYKNGASVATSTLSFTPATNSSNMFVGWSNVNSNYSFTGILDEVRLYSRALMADDIAELYRTPIWATTCSSPTGNAGDIIYDTTTRKMAYCNAAVWVQMGPGPKGGGGCTSPSASAGAIVFDSSNKVIKHCNGQEWAPWGIVGGTGTGTGCTSPTGIGGAIVFNADFRVMQYCDGKTWQMVGGYQPTFVADFAGGKYMINGTSYASYSAFKTALGLSFTRATTATYYNSSGLVATAASGAERFDYDPVTKQPKGLLIEEQRTNLFLRSNTFNNASWSNGGVTLTANAATAPDGTTTAWSVNPTQAGGLAYLNQNVTFGTGKVTFSIYAKAGVGQYFWMDSFIDGNEWGTQFDLSNGTVTNVAPGMVASMQNVGNGWYRIIVTGTMTKTSAQGSGLSTFYVDDYGEGINGHNVYLWGAQIEVGPDASSYIPTTTATVTRNADVVAFPGTGTWYDATKGTFVAEAYAGMESSDPTNTLYYYGVILGQSSSPNGDKNWLGYGNAPTKMSSWPGANETNTSFSPAVSRIVNNKQAVTWTDSTLAYKQAVNGTPQSGTTSYSGKDWTITTFSLGSTTGNSYFLDGSVRSLVYYPFRVPDTILQTMSQRSQ